MDTALFWGRERNTRPFGGNSSFVVCLVLENAKKRVSIIKSSLNPDKGKAKTKELEQSKGVKHDVAEWLSCQARRHTPVAFGNSGHPPSQTKSQYQSQ